MTHCVLYNRGTDTLAMTLVSYTGLAPFVMGMQADG